MELFTTSAIGPNQGVCRCACWANHPASTFEGRRLTCSGTAETGDVCDACLAAMGATYTMAAQ